MNSGHTASEIRGRINPSTPQRDERFLASDSPVRDLRGVGEPLEASVSESLFVRIVKLGDTSSGKDTA